MYNNEIAPIMFIILIYLITMVNATIVGCVVVVENH